MTAGGGDTATIVVGEGVFNDVSVEEAHAGDSATISLARIDDPADVATATREADALIVTTHALTRAHVEQLQSTVRVVARAGVGVDAIDLVALRERGIALVNTPGYATEEVATHAVALLLALQRRLVSADAVARDNWRDWRRVGAIAPLQEMTVGLVGCGRIGRAFTARIVPLVAHVLVYDPLASESPPRTELVGGLAELLERSDAISLHAPLTEETAGIIDGEAIARMRHGALLVNVARGGLVDETAAADALHAGQLGGVAVDVLAEEPPPVDAPLLGAPGTLVTPHIAWYSSGSERRVREQAVDGVLRVLAGRSPEPAAFVVRP